MSVLPLLFAFLQATGTAAEDPAAMQHARRSYALSQRGDLDAAAAEMRIAISSAPKNPLYLTALGGILSRQGKPLEARQALESAVALDPKHPAIRFQLAARQAETGQMESARENLIRILTAGTSNSEAKTMLETVSLQLGAVLARERRWKAGLALASDTAERYPDSAPAWQMLGLFQTRNQANILAVSSYTKALGLNSECLDCAIGLGIAQAQAGLTEEALKTLEQAYRRWPENAVLCQALGILLLRIGETGSRSGQRALPFLQRAVELDPTLTEAQFQLGNYALDTNDNPGAVERLSVAARSPEAPAKVFYALSRAWRRLGKDAEADEAMRVFRQRKQQEELAAVRR